MKVFYSIGTVFSFFKITHNLYSSTLSLLNFLNSKTVKMNTINMNIISAISLPEYTPLTPYILENNNTIGIFKTIILNKRTPNTVVPLPKEIKRVLLKYAKPITGINMLRILKLSTSFSVKFTSGKIKLKKLLGDSCKVYQIKSSKTIPKIEKVK